MPSELRTVFERLGTLEKLEIRNSQALAKPKRETISHNRLLEALTFKETRTYRYNPLDRNINSATNLVHRTTVHMWRWFNSSDSFVRLLWPCSCSYESQKKHYPSFSVNPQPFALQYKPTTTRTERHKYKLCELCVFVVLNLIKSWCESPIGRRVTITQTLDRIRLCLG